MKTLWRFFAGSVLLAAIILGAALAIVIGLAVVSLLASNLQMAGYEKTGTAVFGVLLFVVVCAAAAYLHHWFPSRPTAAGLPRRFLPANSSGRVGQHRIITARTPGQLEDRVDQAMQEGWQPSGGVSSTGFLGTTLMQTMVR